MIEVSETAASLPFTLATIWLRFIASSPDLWLPKCFTSILEPFVVTLPAIVDESHWLLDSEALLCSTLTTGCRSWVAAWRGAHTTGGRRCRGPSSLLGEPLNPPGCTLGPPSSRPGEPLNPWILGDSSLDGSSSRSCLRETRTALLISCLKVQI